MVLVLILSYLIFIIQRMVSPPRGAQVREAGAGRAAAEAAADDAARAPPPLPSPLPY